MTFLIDSEQLKYFSDHGQIEFEHVLTQEQIQKLKQEIHIQIASDAKNKTLKKGFDLFRERPQLKPFMCSSKWPKIAMQLLKSSHIRYGFSQYIGPACQDPSFIYSQRKSCLKDLVLGVCFALDTIDQPENPFCPTQAGHMSAFLLDEDFYLRYPKTESEYLFIFYAHPKTYFAHQLEDPLHPFFRSLGYEQGDLLKEVLNPSFKFKS